MGADPIGGARRGQETRLRPAPWPKRMAQVHGSSARSGLISETKPWYKSLEEQRETLSPTGCPYRRGIDRRRLAGAEHGGRTDPPEPSGAAGGRTPPPAPPPPPFPP